MANKLVIVISRGMDDERASVAWSIANGGLASDMEVTVFLVAAGVDWVRKGAAAHAHLNPYDPPMSEMIGRNASSVCRVPLKLMVRGSKPFFAAA